MEMRTPESYNRPVMGDATSAQRQPTVAIIGVGLIGGSIAAALKKRRRAERVFGVGRTLSRLEKARAAGLIDAGTSEVGEAVPDADLVVVCTPVDRIADDVRAAAAYCRPGTLLTDAGSVKGAICRALAGGLPDGVTFIGSHPLAGSEQQGFEHADAGLFEGRLCVITPEGKASTADRERLTAFWEGLGMNVVETSPDEHDRALAATSHLPHVAAAALAALLAEDNGAFASTGFRDTTRIAAGDPNLWTPILLSNREAVLQCLGEFQNLLAEFRDALEKEDTTALKNLLEVAKRNRDVLSDS